MSNRFRRAMANRDAVRRQYQAEPDYGGDCPSCGDVLGVNAEVCETCAEYADG